MADPGPNDIVVSVSGGDFFNWTIASVSTGIQTAASNFAMTVMRSGAAREALPIFGNEPCEIRVGEQKLITGFIEGVMPSSTKDANSETFSGRSKTADLIDCSAEAKPGTFNSQFPETIAAALSRPYSVDVVVDPGVLTGFDAIPSFRLSPGERIHAAIIRAVRLRSLLVTDNSLGQLVITTAGARKATGRIVRGENILASSGGTNTSQVYSEYECKGQTVASDDAFGDSANAIEAVFRDSEVSRFRKLILSPESAANSERCLARAQREAVVRLGQASKYTYTLYGWYQPDGTLWRKNTEVFVDDPFSKMEGEFLISHVTYRIDKDNGRVVDLAVGPKGAFAPTLPQNARKGIGAWDTSILGANLANQVIEGEIGIVLDPEEVITGEITIILDPDPGGTVMDEGAVGGPDQLIAAGLLDAATGELLDIAATL